MISKRMAQFDIHKHPGITQSVNREREQCHVLRTIQIPNSYHYKQGDYRHMHSETHQGHYPFNFIKQLIQQDKSARTMDPNSQSTQDHTQQGLFTICFNAHPLIHYSHQQHQPQNTPQTLIRKFKSETIIKTSYRVRSKPNSLATSYRGLSPKKHPKICQKDINSAQLPQGIMIKSPSSLERARTQTTLQLNDKPQCKFHIQNIMEHFAYQITKPSPKREKTIPDGNVHLRTPSKMLKTDMQHEAPNSSIAGWTLLKSHPVQQSQVINSDSTKISHPKYKPPLISYLLKQQSRRTVVKNQTRALQQRAGLYNVVTINNPYQGQREKGRTTRK